ncbi:MAG: Holliday junction branch migration protein RuvA [Magnetovibrionaceae bacterium]
MIALLKGLVAELGDDHLVIDVNGVGYLVFCSSRTLGSLGAGNAVTLKIETHVREDHIHLYGFLDAGERDWFKLLTTVQGVGAKVGLAILGVLGPGELVQAVAAGDKAQISRAPGVGPKLAGRIASELKDKIGAMALGPAAGSKKATGSVPAASVPTGADQVLRDAASALVNLGYGPSEALSAVSRAASATEGEATVESLIRDGLAELAGGVA